MARKLLSDLIIFCYFKTSLQSGKEEVVGGAIGGRSCLDFLIKSSDIERESLTVLKQIQQQLRVDSERLDRVSGKLESTMK